MYIQGSLEVWYNLYQNSNDNFHRIRENNSKIFRETQKTSNRQKNFEKQKQAWKFCAPWFQTISQSTVIKTVCHWHINGHKDQYTSLVGSDINPHL